MSTKEISAAAQALGRRGGLKSLGAKSKAELSAFGKAAAEKRWKKPARCEVSSGCVFSPGHQGLCHVQDPADPNKWIQPVGGMFSAGAQGRFDPEEHRYPGGNMPDPQSLMMLAASPRTQQLEALAGAVGLNGAVVKVEPAKPKRPLPKAGTVSALVLEVLRGDGPNESVDIAKELYYSAKLNVRNTTEAYEQVKNALSSLRSAGHVVSVPKPGSRREKLWRLT